MHRLIALALGLLAGCGVSNAATTVPAGKYAIWLADPAENVYGGATALADGTGDTLHFDVKFWTNPATKFAQYDIDITVLDPVQGRQPITNAVGHGATGGAGYIDLDPAGWRCIGQCLLISKHPNTPPLVFTGGGTWRLSMVPLPAALPLFGTALLGLAAIRARRGRLA